MTQSDIDAKFLKERPEDQRFWVVRASGGQYVRLFREAGIVAIGHLNPLRLSDGPLLEGNAAAFEAELKKSDPDRPKASITAHANQAEAFCFTMKKDDIVVTLDSDALMIGRVTGDPYFANEPFVQNWSDAPSEKLTHRLRREVSWGPLLSRGSVPVAMQMTLFAHQTIFNIDRYWTSVYHLLYPCFTFDGRLYLSANIKQKAALNNYSISQLFSLLSGVEAMGKLWANDSDEWKNYPENMEGLSDSMSLNLSSKAEFMSPGTVWSMITTTTPEMIGIAMVYVMLFGGDLKFFKADGLIDIHTRQKLWDMVLKLKETHKVSKLKDDLKVDVPKIDTAPLDKPKKPRKAKTGPKLIVEKSDEDQSIKSTPPHGN